MTAWQTVKDFFVGLVSPGEALPATTRFNVDRIRDLQAYRAQCVDAGQLAIITALDAEIATLSSRPNDLYLDE